MDVSLNSLPPEKKRELLAKALRKKAEKPSIHPLSFSQERLWLLHQLDPSSPSYNISFILHLKGYLNRQSIQKAVDEILARHQSLRTTFLMVDGKPIQVVAPAMTLALPISDLRQLSDESREKEVERLKVENTQSPFDLTQGPLIRPLILQVSDDEHLVLLTVHHVISDGWSIKVFILEMMALYNAFLAGKPSPLPLLKSQYTDYARLQRKTMQGEVLQVHLSYWQEKLSGASPSLELPIDFPRPPVQRFRGAVHAHALPGDTAEALDHFCKLHQVTLFMAMLAALEIALFKWTDQSDMVVGTVTANRNSLETEQIIGCFVNFLPLRLQVSNDESGLDMLEKVKSTVLEAHSHQDCPFEKIVETINPPRSSASNAIYNVGLLLHNLRLPTSMRVNATLEAISVRVSNQSSLLDLRLIALPLLNLQDGIHLDWEYNTDLFQHSTIERFADFYVQTMTALIRNPERKIGTHELPQPLAEAARSARVKQQKRTITVSSTFTAEPVREPINFWLEELHIPAVIEFAPYNQVFHQLLDPSSLVSQNRNGVNVLLVRMEDWLRFAAGDSTECLPTDELTEKMERNARDLVSSLKSAVARTSTPFLLGFCPASPDMEDHGEQKGHFERLEKVVRSELEAVAGISIMTSSEILGAYPVANYYDPHGDKLGHIPFQPVFFSSLGTIIARRIHALWRTPYKVIVLDCDQTLWKGVCGEDGPEGIAVDPPRWTLQEFMAAQFDAGMLLCLCSKNNEADIIKVFDLHSEMPLKKNHFVSRRINWKPKSENIKSLAEELQLGLDTFIFIDDDPVVCAEVRANCPQVLTLHLPSDPEEIPTFINNIWAFDHPSITSDDRIRSRFYQQDAERKLFESQSLTMKDFFAGLDLKVRIKAMAPHHIPRVAQLTNRTNQFNFTTIRRSEGEIRAICQSGKRQCLVVEVSDRFGDYGLVGVLILDRQGDAINLDTFLLSCRALGRGIEHRMLSRVGEIALDDGHAFVDVLHSPTARNRPAQEFMESLGLDPPKPYRGGLLYRIPASLAASVRYEPMEESQARSEGMAQEKVPASATEDSLSSAALGNTETYVRIADRFHNAEMIHQAITSQCRRKRPELDESYMAPRTNMEAFLAEMWARALGVERVGIHDNFFALGGHSLMAAMMFSRLRETFSVELPLSSALRYPSVAELAEHIEEVMAGGNIKADGLTGPANPLVLLQRGGVRPPLFCLHPAGGQVNSYVHFAGLMDHDVPVFGIQSRAVQDPLLEHHTIAAMAEDYADVILSRQPAGSYHVVGYSFGGVLALATAAALEKKGQSVAFVGLLDPVLPDSHGEFLNRTAIHSVISYLQGSVLRSFSLQDGNKAENLEGHLNTLFEDLQGISMEDGLPWLMDFVRANQEILMGAPVEFVEQHLDLLRSHIYLIKTFSATSIHAPLYLWRAGERGGLEGAGDSIDWSKCTTGGFSLEEVDGDHFRMMQPPYVDNTAARVAQVLRAIHGLS